VAASVAVFEATLDFGACTFFLLGFAFLFAVALFALPVFPVALRLRLEGPTTQMLE
jgi:hypothetical protein